MANRLTFVLDGRDQLSRVLDRAGDSATRLQRRLAAASINGDAAMRRLGNSTTRSMAGLQRDADIGGKAAQALKGALISLAPAAIPAAASLAPIAPAAGAAAVATAAYAAALGPQIAAMSEASEAEKKYTDEVEKSGRTSQAAVTAQMEYVRTVASMPPATRRAAAGLSVLKDEYKQWSDSLAEDTLGPVTKGMAIFTGLLPKTTGLVKGASAQLDRMMTIVAGGMESPGLDGLNKRFTEFATGTLQRVNDGLVRLMRTTDTGKVGGGLAEFMDFARAQGPVVAETLRSIGTALMNVLEAGADVGVGMLQVVNALAGIVAAVPPGVLTTMLQLAIAIKAVRLAAVGMGAARTAMAAFGVQLLAMQTAAAGAPGPLARATAAIGALGRGAKLAIAGTGIGLLLIAITELSARGKSAPPDVDRLTTSLGKLGDTGKVTGEAAKAFGADLGGLAESLRVLARPSTTQSIEKSFSDFFGYGEGGPDARAAKEDIDAVDKSLANLVSGGKADLAEAAFAKMATAMRKQGMTSSELRGKLDDYKAALADQQFEQELAAQSMGLFGAQAQSVQAKLDAQKASTDGLRQSIIALNEVNRQALDGRAGMEAAIDAAAKAATAHSDALRITNGELNLNSEKARTAQAALTDLARKTEGNVTAARDSGKSWEYAKGQYDRGRAALIRSADAMGLTRAQAVTLAGQIMKTPNKTAYLKGNLSDLQAKLADAKTRLAKAPSSKTAAIRGEISDLQRKIAQAKTAIGSVQGKTVSVMVQYRSSHSGGSDFLKSIGGYASGGKPKPGELAWVGEEGPELVRFGGGGAEVYDHRSSMAMVSDASAAGRDAGLGLQRGMGVSTAGVEASGRALAGAIVAGVRDELQIASPSKKMQALMKDVAKGIVTGLTGSKAQIKATAKDLVKDIWAAWKGTGSKKDSHLVAMVNKDTAKLQKLAAARDKVAATIAQAKKLQADITANAREGAGLSNLGMADEEVSAGGIQAGLAEKLSKINQFARYVQSLAKRGLSKSLLQQILAMGPEQGYAYASALAGSSASTLKAINSTQGKINSASAQLGRTGADGMYDAGKQAGKGILTGLASQQAAIEKQMVKIAKAMEKAIKKALGIKSPSTVMAGLGRYTTEGLALGMTDRMPVLDQALTAVTDRVANTRPVIGRPAVAGAGAGGVVYNISVDVRDAMDPVAVGREMQRVLVKYGRAQGATVNLSVGR
ncbi:hypothetical protein [Streptomyces clavifer]|uniref:hypothetical protein n=1 Tax=Streptomyces clavifer TaxID=68188 RepID=UPI0030857B3F|nr:hypothetical protein OG388_26650 [Streptomyces clavifer]